MMPKDKKDKYDLFKKPYPENAGASEEARIEALRATARGYTDTHNGLVQQLWDMDQKIAQLKNGEDHSALKDEKAALVRKINEADYINKIDVLLEEIKAWEIAVHGHSDIGSNSPYIL